MAIFGKKKEKSDKDGSSTGTQSPSVDGRGHQRPGANSRENTPGTVGSINGHHNPSSSLSGPPVGILQQPGNLGNPGQSVPLGQNYSQQPPQQQASNYAGNPQALRQPGSTGGLPGAASGFRFGGQGATGIPQPSGGSMRGPAAGRKFSQDAGETSSGSIAPTQGPVNAAGVAGMGAGGATPNTFPQGAPVSGLPPSSVVGPPNLTGVSGPASGGQPTDKTRQHVVYPWSQRTLTMNPPRYLDENRQGPPGALSPSPFPRYGHAANAMASPNGEVYLFGGLVYKAVKNDLYTVHVDKISQPGGTPQQGSQSHITIASGHGVNATLVQTTGEIPPPRVGHATVLVSNVLILWGGDTKVRADDMHDEGLYLLNLSTREWTRVKSDAPNSGPVGRYGHTVSIVGSRFYVFGGQVDGTFLNDLWSFDLNSLKGTPTWELLKPATAESPPRRTGHASVTYKDKIYIFGGTDGQYHYNDTWCYDITTNTWKELSCIGYIPVPREGHATCLVDDVMYIFGGRGVDGNDLGDLASFKISNQRWYMFANMGPAPTGRSGHVLTTYQNKVLVLGGESFTGGNADDPNIVHVLDTAKIKYPPDNRAPSGARKTSLQGGQSAPGSQAASPTSPSDFARSVSPTQSQQPITRAISPTGQPIPPASSATAGNGLVSMMRQADGIDPVKKPEEVVVAPQNRAMSPSQQQQQSTRNISGGSTGASQFQLTNKPAPYTGPRSQRSIENLRSQNGGAVSPTSGIVAQRSINGALERSTSPTGNTVQDGFHYGSRGSPSLAGQANGFLPPRGEMEAMKKREAWMKAALALAYKKGFVAPDELEMPDGTHASSRDSQLNIDSIDTGSEGSDKDRILRALVALKSQLSTAKATISQQAQSEADRVAEADRGRLAALQEAAFFRAKLHALEKGDTGEATKLDRERAAHSEKQLSDALRESAELERQIQSLREDLKLEQNLRSSAEERLSETAKRAMAAEGAQMRAYDELAMLQKRSYGHETSLRDHQDQVAQLTTLVARHRSDHETARSQLEEAQDSLQTHTAAFAQLQAALLAAQSQAAEHERLHFRHRDVSTQHQDTINRLRSALDAKTAEAEGHSSRITDLEALLASHKNEAESHRSALNGQLARLVTLHQQKTASRGPSDELPEHVTDKISALETEADSLRQLHNESRSAADNASSALQDLRDRNVALEKQHSGLRTELSAMRSQLAIALQEVSRLKDQGSSKDLEVRDRARALEAAQLRDNLLRQYISDRGIGVPGDEQLSAKSGFADRRIRELEAEIDARTQEAQEMESRLDESTRQVEALSRELQTGERDLSRGLSGNEEELERRAEAAERELSETTASYRERMARLEEEYQTAANVVRGTEIVLRRVKGELTKCKTENAALLSELATARSAASSGGDGAAGAEAAKDIEALRTRLVDITQQAEETAAENRELEKKLAALAADHRGLHDQSKVREDTQIDHSRRAAELESEVSRLRKEVHDMLALNQHLSNELKSANGGTRGVGAGGLPATQSASGLSQYGSQGSSRELDILSNQNDQLKVENDGLARRLQETEDKLSLLLGGMESSVDGDGLVPGGHHLADRGGSSTSHGSVGPSGGRGANIGPGSGGHGSQLGGGSTHGGAGGRFSITSELEKWEKDGSLLGVGIGTPGGQTAAARD